MAAERNWYVQRGDATEGPFTPRQLKTLADQGQLAPDNQVKRETDTKWLRAAKLPGLFDSAPVPAVPAAMPIHAVPMANPDRIACPFCGEMIAASAVKCRFCNEFLDGRQSHTTAPQPQSAAQSVGQVTVMQSVAVMDKSKPRKGVSAFGVASFIFGMLALLIALVPLLNILAIPLVAIGVLLGTAGILTSLIFRRAGLAWPLTGLSLCVAAFFLGWYMAAFYARGINSLVGAQQKPQPAQVKATAVKD